MQKIRKILGAISEKTALPTCQPNNQPIINNADFIGPGCWCRPIKRTKKINKELQTISIYWFYLLCNNVATSNKPKLFVTYTFVYP